VVHWHADVVQSRIDTRLALAYPLYQPFERRLLAHAGRIIATSRAYLDTSSTLGPWIHKARVIPLGIQDRPAGTGSGIAFEPPVISGTDTCPSWHPGSVRLLCIGRLTYYKGHRHLIEALADVGEVHLILVGQGELRQELLGTVRRMGLEHRVTLAGYRDEESLQDLMESCDIVLLPSVERTEAFGLVLLEAMRAAKPVIAGRVKGSGMGWVVQEGVTGLLVPPGDVPGLSRAVRRLASSPALRRFLGNAGRKRFLERFRIEKTALDMIRVYGELLS
jgi:rhamnosyl/mannosyltransferase